MRFGDFAGLQAAGADFDSQRSAVHFGADILQIGVETPFSDIVGV